MNPVERKAYNAAYYVANKQKYQEYYETRKSKLSGKKRRKEYEQRYYQDNKSTILPKQKLYRCYGSTLITSDTTLYK